MQMWSIRFIGKTEPILLHMGKLELFLQQKAMRTPTMEIAELKLIDVI